MDQKLSDPTYQDYNQLKTKKMEYQAKAEVFRLTQQPKYMYPLFNLFELELNRFHSMPEFSKLEGQVIAFNKELEDWKNKDMAIKNVLLTYHLYKSLFSRIKYTSSLVLDRNDAKRALKEIDRWFAEEKPKVRNKAPEKEEGCLKENTEDRETQADIDSLLVSHVNKRDLKVYEAMTRTSHKEFFPPKERLIEYKRRDLIEGGQSQARRASSMTTLSKGMGRYRGSFGTTRTSFFKGSSGQPQTKTQQPKEEQKQQPVVVPFNMQQPKEREEGEQLLEGGPLEDINREKQVHQEQMLQQNMVKVVNEQDLLDGEEEIESEEEKKQALRYKKYQEDPNIDIQLMAEQNIKDVKQSTLRRILRQKEEAIRRKMEELSMAQQMKNWGGTKSRWNSEEHRKLERMQLANKYRQLEFVPRSFNERQSALRKEVPEFQTYYRSKSSHPGTVEQDIEKMKINSALKTYGKYINHVNIVPIKPDSEEERDQIKVMRSTSLTGFCRQGKKTPFSAIVNANGTESQNEEAVDEMIRIKDRLAKTAIPVQKRDILMGITVTDTSKMELPGSKAVYPPLKALYNNPFFPKHLYQAKAKSKKK